MQFAVWVEDGAPNDDPGTSPRGFLGVSLPPGSFLVPRSMAGKGVSWPHLYLSLYGQCRIGSLQLAIHVVQNRRAGEQKSHWEKTNKENYHLKLCMSFFVLSQCDFCSPAWRFCTTWMASCKGPIVCFVVKSGFSQKILVLKLPQIFKLNLANKKDQVSFSSDRDNVNSGQYCTENKQAPPRTPHWSPTSIIVLVYNAAGLSCNPQITTPGLVDCDLVDDDELYFCVWSPSWPSKAY